MKMTTPKTRIQAAVLSLALLLPAGSSFAATRHYRHRHHYSQTRGAIVGGVAGAVIDHKHPVEGGLIGAALGAGVQAVRNHKQ
jgi:glycine zipper 2TM protein